MSRNTFHTKITFVDEVENEQSYSGKPRNVSLCQNDPVAHCTMVLAFEIRLSLHRRVYFRILSQYHILCW